MADEEQQQSDVIDNLETQDDDDFESGFAGNQPADDDQDDNDDDSTDDNPAGEQEQQQEQQPVSFDPHAEFQKLSQRMRNLEGNLGGIKSALSRLSGREQQQAIDDATDAAKAAGGDAPTKQQAREALKSGDKFEQFAKEFPEWGEAMQELLLMNGQGGSVDAESILQQADQRATERVEKLKSTIVESRHRGWEKVVKTPEFNAWFDSQGDEVKALAESDNPVDVIEVLDRYSALQKPQSNSPGNKKPSNNRLAQAVPPTNGRTSTVSSAPSEDDDFLAGFKQRN
jgi:hypothetical protein